ncbi:MAG: hypothetical protein LBR91_02360 [Puniceicoccales bacterium]|jgi:hypothetical protein|nr:hypothetical protein [Puniceicoccales bacterium]
MYRGVFIVGGISVESGVEVENVGCVRSSEIETAAVVDLSVALQAAVICWFYGRVVSAAACGAFLAAIAHFGSNFKGTSIVDRKSDVVTLTPKSPKRSKLARRTSSVVEVSSIDMLSLYTKHGKDILRLKKDTLRFLKVEPSNAIEKVIDCRFAPLFFKENEENADSFDKQYLRGVVWYILKLIIKPEHVESVYCSWLSLADTVSARAFYGILKYTFGA